MRRIFLTPLAALAVLGATACGPESPAAAPTRTPTGTPTASAAPEPSGTPTSPPGPAPHLGSWTVVAHETLPGTLVLAASRQRGDSATGLDILVLRDGELRRAALVEGDAMGGPQSCVVNSLLLSPDGSKLAYVTGDAGGDNRGDLTVVNLDGSGQRVVAHSVNCGGGAAPVWFPDSARLAATIDGTRVEVSPGGASKPIPGDGWNDYVAFSPGGKYRAYRDEHAQDLVVVTASGAPVRRLAYTMRNDPCGCGYAVVALSVDGRYAAVGIHNTDPSRVSSANRIVDTVTGREQAPPAGYSFLYQFLRDGGMIIMDGQTIAVVGPAGRPTHAVTPNLPGTRVIGVLGYTP